VPGSGEDFARGVTFVLPFGTIYSSNITSDPENRHRRTERRGLRPRRAGRPCAGYSDAEIAALCNFVIRYVGNQPGHADGAGRRATT